MSKGKSSSKEKTTQSISKEERKAKDKALRQAVKKVQRLEKSVSKAEEELKEKNEELNSVDPSDRKKMTDLSYKFEEVQRKHDDLLQQWEDALLEKEKLEE